jgi:hypothetical protein
VAEQSAPKRDRSGLVVLAVLVGGLVVIAALGRLNDARFPAPKPTPTAPAAVARATPKPTPTVPDEPCTIDAPQMGRSAAQKWCAGGIFKNVSLQADGRAMTATLRFSAKGEAAWRASAQLAIIHKLRESTDEIVEQADVSMAYSLWSADGQRLLGGCVRQVSQRESTCRVFAR